MRPTTESGRHRRASFAAAVLAVLLPGALVAGCGASQPRPAASAVKEAWDPSNDPLRLGGHYERSLAALPLSGQLDRKPWSDTYWPSSNAGISYRWKTDGIDQFNYVVTPVEQLRGMSAAEMAKLSPAEKFDIYTGRYSYPLVARERQRTHPTDASWFGICHGWSAAAINFDEPKPVLMTSADGLQVPFGSSDVKALLSYYQGEIAGSAVHVLGSRCNIDISAHPDHALDPACRDTNAGSFHVVLTNQIGTLHQAFIADVARDVQIWNQPIHGFTTRIVNYQAPSPGAAPGTVKEAVIETVMRYALEISPIWDAGRRSDTDHTYNYRVELDAAGQIIGGEWMQEDRPDFLWTHDKPAFGGYFAKLGELYPASLAAAPFADPTLGDF